MPSEVVRESAPGLAPEALALKLAEAALEKKAGAPAIIDAGALSGYADYFVLLSGTNERQVLAIADAVERCAKAVGVRPMGIEGGDGGRWVLIDLGEVVVHVFHEETRAYYDLDGLWSDARRVEVPGAPPTAAF